MPKTLMCDPELLQKDLSGRVYIVTGANSGAGFATSAQLVRQGAHVVGGCRRVEAGKEAFAELENVRGSTEVMQLDLASLASVRRFAEAFSTKHGRLDGLVNNAGIMGPPEGKTEDGFETQFGVNYLGHFLLAELLLETLKASAPSRIVCVSSVVHVGRRDQVGEIYLSEFVRELQPSARVVSNNFKFPGLKLARADDKADSISIAWYRTRSKKPIQYDNGKNEEVYDMSKEWTTEDMPDLTGKVAIVTGANSGIGYYTAVAFAEKGATVILACRNLEKSQAALDQLKTDVPGAEAELMQLDLASLASVRRFSDAFQEKYDRLDLLVNNAGIMMVPYGKTEDGFERQFGTNHLGHFALTGLLLETILATPGARVVNVSSMGHRFGQMDFDDLMYEGGEGYSGSGAYSRSKLANLLFTYELQRRFEAVGAEAIATAAHPGGTNTNLQDEVGSRWYVRPFVPLMRMMMQDASIGALPTVRAAVDPDAEGGQYYGPGGFMEQRGYPVLVQSNGASHNLADAQRLWQVSEELTGISFGVLDVDAVV